MSGLRLYVHDNHGRHVNGDVRVRRARAERWCDGHRCESRRIGAGDWYATATMYPSDDDFSYVKPGRYGGWEKSNTPARLNLCSPCLTEESRDLIAAIEMDLASASLTQAGEDHDDERHMPWSTDHPVGGA